MVCGVPTCWWVTLSIVVIVTAPLYVWGCNPLRLTPIVAVALDLRLRLPVAGETVNQALLVEADHESVCWQVPLALMLAFCAGGSGCPTIP